MQPRNLTEVIQYIAQQQRENLAKEIAEAQRKIITITFDRAATYTVVVIFGGYAGYFAIWQLSKDYLSRAEALWAALLILVSLLFFVLFEVFKMVSITRTTIARAALLQRPDVRQDPDRLLQELKALDESQHSGSRLYMAVWAFSAAVSVLGALAGAIILGRAFISGLAQGGSLVGL